MALLHTVDSEANCPACLPFHSDHLGVFKFLVPEAESTTCLPVTCLPFRAVDALSW